MQEILVQLWQWVKEHPIETVLFPLFAYLTCKYLLWLMRYWYVSNVKNVYIKVVMPREDSQRDKEKDNEKDFKEKIAVMEQFYRAISELAELNAMNIIRTWFFHSDVISFEIVVQEKIIEFYVVTVQSYSQIIEKQITSYYPNAEIQIVEPYEIAPKESKVKAFFAYQKRGFWFPIKTYKTVENDPLNDLTNIFSKVQENEKAVIQVMIRPKNKKWQTEAKKYGSDLFLGRQMSESGTKMKIPGLSFLGNLFTGLVWGYDKISKESESDDGKAVGKGFVRMLQTTEEAAKKIGQKAEKSGFDTCIRLISSAPTTERAEEIMDNMVVAFSVFKDDGANWFQTRRIVPIDVINNWLMLKHFRNRVLETRIFGFGEKRSVLVDEELASIFHFPTSKYNQTPNIRWLLYKILPPPPELPDTGGITLGNNVYRGAKKAIHLLDGDRMKHHYVIGKSGTGKSSFIGYMARQDIIQGKGVGIIDPHGDLIEDVLDFIPKERAKDVIIFDPSDQARPMGLNILEATTVEQMDLAASQATEIFIKLFGDEIFGPRIQHYFRNACLTLMEDHEEGATLIDVPRIFVDPPFMKYKVAKVKNPIVRSFWEHEYAETGDRERQEMIPYFSAKFGPFITNTIMRNTIGQTKSAFNFRECMDQGKILLVKLSKGKIGDLNTQLLGLVIVARLQMAAMSRVDTPLEKRRPFLLYVDEFQNFATDSFSSILSEARKYGLGLIMAHQYISQLVVNKFGNSSTQIRDAVFGNVGTMTCFKIGAEDSEFITKEFAPVLTEQDLIGISNYKAYMKMSINGTTSRPFSLESIYDNTGKNKKVGEIIKEYSRMKYGRKKEFVEKEIEGRIGIELITEIEKVTPEGEAIANTQGATPAPVQETPTEEITPVPETPPEKSPAEETTPAAPTP